MSDVQEKRIDAYTIDGDLFIALINEEEQYSIWPAKKRSLWAGNRWGSADLNKKSQLTSTSTGPICAQPLCVARWTVKSNIESINVR